MNSLRIFCYNRKRAVASVLSTFVFVLVLGILWLKAAPAYESTSVVTILPTNFEISYQDGRSDLAGINAASVLTQTHTESMLSRSLAESVVAKALAEYTPQPPPRTFFLTLNEKLIIPAKTLFWKVYFTLNSGKYVQPTLLEDLTNDLIDGTEIKNVPGSYILSISVLWDDPKVAQILARLLTEVYIEKTSRSNETAISDALKRLQSRKDSIDSQLGAINIEIQKFKQDKKLFAMDKSLEFKMDDLKTYQTQYNDQRIKIMTLKGELENMKNLSSSTDYEKMKADLRLAESLFKNLEAIVASKQAELSSMPANERSFDDLLVDQENYKSRLAMVNESIGRIKLAESVGLDPVKVIDPPVAAVYPKYPKLLFNAIGSVILGVLLVIGWIMTEEALNPRVREAGDLVPGIKALGTLPAISKSDSSLRLPGLFYLFGPPKRLFHSHLQYLCSRIFPEGSPQVVLLAGFTGNKTKPRLLEGIIRHGNPFLAIDLEGRTAAPEGMKPIALDAVNSGSLDGGRWRAFAPAGHVGDGILLQFKGSDFTAQDFRALESMVHSLKSRGNIVIHVPPYNVFPMGHRIGRLVDKSILVVSANSTRVAQVKKHLEIHGENADKSHAVLSDVEYIPDLTFHL